MDDLVDLDWQSSKPTPSQKSSNANYYPSLRPTPPISGSSTPAIQGPFNPQKPVNGAASRSNTTTPGNDSFANLVSFRGNQPTSTLSLQERQKQLEEQKRQQHNLTQPSGLAVGSEDGAFWEQLGSGRSTPNTVTSPPAYAATSDYGGHKLSATVNKPFQGINGLTQPKDSEEVTNDKEDLLSGFNNTANRLKNVPRSTEAAELRPPSRPLRSLGGLKSDDVGQSPSELDDDPFGLGMTNSKKVNYNSNGKSDITEYDDVLGLLGRPVSEFKQRSTPELQPTQHHVDKAIHPQDQAFVELVDMGFSPEKSREALESTESGIDVQAAVGWLLNQAQQESKKKSQAPQDIRDNSLPRKGRRRSSGSRTSSSALAWARHNGEPQDPHRQNSRSPAQGEKDPSKIASELGNNLFKTANSLWKTGTKKLNQAVAELNSDSDSSQPKWMRGAKVEAGHQLQRPQKRLDEANDLDRKAVKSMQRAPVEQSQASVTDEALMLESADARPTRKAPLRQNPDELALDQDLLRRKSPLMGKRPPDLEVQQPRFMQQSRSNDPRSRLNRQKLEEQASEAYISPARRKKTLPKPTLEQNPPTTEPELLFGASRPSEPQALAPKPQSRLQTTSRSPAIQPLPTRPRSPKRKTPPLSPSALQNSTRHRLAGKEAFKRGDYAEATNNYTNALSALPQTHPLTLPLLTNRSLSHSKTGDTKASITDADTALDLIGPSRGVSEMIDIEGEGAKDMNLFWGKAMTRKAEALEQLERWSDALEVWKSCVEAGVGGATSIAGRNRCEKAANPPAMIHPRAKPPKPKPRSTALNDLAARPVAASAQSTEAVFRLRAANLEAERVDDEKFALSDLVSERIQSWRAGKEGNLRALLASLETVLWEGARWKKIGMGELILPGKVKVQYMKGIAKVHPDKVCTLITQKQVRMSRKY